MAGSRDKEEPNYKWVVSRIVQMYTGEINCTTSKWVIIYNGDSCLKALYYFFNFRNNKHIKIERNIW